MRVLVVEDDADIASLLRRNFHAADMGCDLAPNGRLALEMVRNANYDAIVLDVMLPEQSGLDVCRILRKQSHDATIIMLSARDSLEDKVEGLEAGADDYVVKPFAFAEILARIQAQGRRRLAEHPDRSNGLIACGDLAFDQQTNQLSYGEKSTELTEREADLLVFMMRNAERTVSREKIFEALWHDQGGAAINVVDVYIGYLRRKMALLGPDVREAMRTVRGKGFVLCPVNADGEKPVT
ncbi:response regulator transcription factor [Notoacmeibacter sp. MSK16QG-6]|uniref:response regulator transcription factor n=1 Tax=Notoacmeibacter sp. MSK16QG-6 TaxID=2957982 RepID=UPI0020A2166A|nr:response regulator transcription factor [Notoacmeibacter sp. MSK16QG-6]MCP1200665.1 response regulator transcription factor [Notoacmeibacter sp. MSK16QG-6]